MSISFIDFSNKNIKYVIIFASMSLIGYYMFLIDKRVSVLEQKNYIKVEEEEEEEEEDKWEDDEYISNMMSKIGTDEITKCIDLNFNEDKIEELEDNEEKIEEEKIEEDKIEEKREEIEEKREEIEELEGEMEELEGELEEMKLEKCDAVFKSGKKKGCICGKVCKIGFKKCKTHYK